MSERILRLIERLDVPAPASEQIAALDRFDALVAQWSRRANLVGKGGPEARAEVLFADALVLAGLVPIDARFVDVGAGAGAPSIPLALLRPDLRAQLVEPRRNRVAFMRTAIGTLGLVSRVKVLEGRLEETEVGEVEVALSRATFPPAEWLARGRAIAPTVVVLSGAEAPPEPESIRERVDYSLPSTATPRTLAVYGPRESPTK